MGKTEEAQAEFLSAVQLDPLNGISQYNLGCVLEEQGDIDEAIDILPARRAPCRRMPTFISIWRSPTKSAATASLAREQWTLYLRYAPNGPWAKQARMHLKNASGRRKRSAPIPFPAKASRKP